MITTQKELRALFWRSCKFQRHARWTQNQYPADVRICWCDFVENMNRDGIISDALANRATL